MNRHIFPCRRVTTPAFGLAVMVALSVMATPPASAAGMDDMIFTHFEVEQLEYRVGDGSDILAWDANGWIGNDDHRLAFKTEGENPVGKRLEQAEFQFLYRRPVSEFFDVNVGVRHDLRPDPDRTYAVLGIQGLAKQFVHTDANLFISETGDVSARLEIETEWLLTQRLHLVPSAELNVAFSEDAAIESGAGINKLELGLRLQYEVTREFAPYIGLHWERKFGATANHAREEGGDADNLYALAGIKFWF
ncbi:MAG: copper resistance protein B [Rhodospirillaceae bacterium]